MPDLILFKAGKEPELYYNRLTRLAWPVVNVLESDWKLLYQGRADSPQLLLHFEENTSYKLDNSLIC